MKPLTSKTPKPLLPFGNANVLSRLISQIIERYDGDIIVVVGYQKELVTSMIFNHFGNRVSICENNDYANDTNILSLSLAINNTLDSFYVFESDCVFDSEAIDMIFSPDLKQYSSWFSIGMFKSNQLGGISKVGDLGIVEDLKIVQKYDQKYAKYNKLIGVLRVGPNEVRAYVNLLRSAAKKNSKQYYHVPWIENLNLLPCLNTEIGTNHAVAFNTPDEYSSALKLFDVETN